MKAGVHTPTTIDRVIAGVGSVPSLVIHTLIFIAFFSLSFTGILAWDLMFLILTTIASLEAIYLAIFIQFTVNRNPASLREVEEDIDEIQEDVEELEEDIKEMSEEEKEEEEREEAQPRSLAQLTSDMRRILEELEALKGGK